MAMPVAVRGGKLLMGRLAPDTDLLEGLTAACERNGVRLGCVSAIGAVKKARIGYFDQRKGEYVFLELDKDMEVTALAGNVSLKDGKPMVHAHVTLGDSDGRAFGGHLAPGTVVFVCEYVIQALEGGELVRELDPKTGLALWKI